MTTDAEYNFYIDWDDDGDFGTGSDDEFVSEDVAARSEVQFAYGRDEARALSAIQAGETAFDLYNYEGKYSPDNTGSPLYGNLVPGRRVLVEAVHLGNTYTLFRGFIDQFEIKPSRSDTVVSLTVLDMLHKFSVADMHTDMYPSLQTGEAVHVLLDAIGWPTGDDFRDVDSGATTLRWWAQSGSDAFEVLTGIIEAEGPPAVAYVEGDKFIFRDRHHRLIRPESSELQATFRSGKPGDAEPHFCEPMTYNIGWKDLANRVEIQVDETLPDVLSDIFSTGDMITMTSGESRQFDLTGSSGGDGQGGGTGGQESGFIDAIVPVAGVDYTLVSGAFTFALSRTNGLTATLFVDCQSAGQLAGLKVRGRPISVKNSQIVKYDDVGSQSEHGIRTLQDADTSQMGNQHDAFAIAKIIAAQRGQRVPTVEITVNNGNDTRMTQILARQISDRIHIVEPDQTFVDHDFFIDRIEHSVGSAGEDHRVSFICERAPFAVDDPDPPAFFAFGSGMPGFGPHANEGAFSNDGISFTETIMILDDADTGRLGTGGLGW